MDILLIQTIQVAFKGGTSQDKIEEYVNLVNQNDGSVINRYNSFLTGFTFVLVYSHFIYDYAYTKISAKIPDSILASFQGDPIKYVEPDGIAPQWIHRHSDCKVSVEGAKLLSGQ